MMSIDKFNSLVIAANRKNGIYDLTIKNEDEDETCKNEWGDAIMELKEAAEDGEEKKIAKKRIDEFKEITGKEPKISVTK